MQQSYDVVIIGGGVVGSAIARELSRYKLRIAVLEKESDVCTQTSRRNTGMLHAGFLYKTSSLKAICAVEGNQEFDQVARELDVPFKRTGKLIVGFTDEHGYVIKPVKGEYFVLDKLAGQFAKIPVYPAPNPDNTFGTHATPTVDGNVLVGPDSQLARDFQDYESTQAAMDGLIESGSRMFKHMDRAYFIRNFAGIRPKRIDPATGAVQDFVLECRDEAPGVVNLVGIESPGVTSALPLARRAVALIARQEALEPNPDFDPIRHGIRRFADMTDEERAAAIAENPDYGEIFCRCEKVTKAEILQAIHNPLGVHTVNGIKVRTRATMGRCQGGYCETRITEALHRELGEDFRDIHLGPEGSWMFTGSVKGGEPA